MCQHSNWRKIFTDHVALLGHNFCNQKLITFTLIHALNEIFGIIFLISYELVSYYYFYNSWQNHKIWLRKGRTISQRGRVHLAARSEGPGHKQQSKTWFYLHITWGYVFFCYWEPLLSLMELPEISSPYPTPKKKKKEKKNNFKPGFKISSENQYLLCGYVNIYIFLNLTMQYVHWLFCFPRRGYEWTSESSHNNSGLMRGLEIDFVLCYKLSPRINQISIE